MIQIQGVWWPDDVAEKWRHSLDHLGSLDVGLKFCTTRRTAVQAGGNIGLWPRRLAETFARVYTFEPDAISRECLQRNVPASVVVSPAALGAAHGPCRVKHKSLGSHRISTTDEGQSAYMTTVDNMDLFDVDFLQLDIEGYECHALQGAVETIRRSHPVIQVELREFTKHFGKTDDDVRRLLQDLGYRQVRSAPGSDYVFVHKGAV
ncbi:MAG: FkbM family methyltransferase [Acidobacteriota bacterium]|nr:FkbM family methyltransferase [Acidobacteriota bacterium]